MFQVFLYPKLSNNFDVLLSICAIFAFKIKNMGKVCLDGIRNLLFDLGGVIMDLRREDCVSALEELGLAEANEMLGLYCQSGPFLLLEEGKMQPVAFRNEIRRRIGKDIADADIDNAFNRFLVGIPVERLRMLEKLKADYRVYMLSNTNPIMFDSKIREEFRKDGKSVEDYFDGICTSYEEHCAKPDLQIFRNLLSKFDIRAEETLFFDDSQRNLDAAAELGFKTWLVAPGSEFSDAFEK